MFYFLKFLGLSLSALSLFFSVHVSLSAQDVALPSYIEKITIKGEKGFPLSATFYQGEPKAAGVLMLHGCEHDQKL